MSPKHAKPDPTDDPPQAPDLPPGPAEQTQAPDEPSVPDLPPGLAAPAGDPPGQAELPEPDREAAGRHAAAAQPALSAPASRPAAVPGPPEAPQRRVRRGRTPRCGRRSSRRPPVRSRWMWTLLALVGFGLVVALVVSAIGTPDPGQGEPSASPTVAAEQETLLIQVRNDADLGADNMIAGVGAQLPTAQVLIPSRLIVDVPGAGQQTLGQSARLLDRSASQDALSDLLALRVDGTLSLSRLALAGMVDFVGGITVDVDRPITVEDETTGAETVVVPEGPHLLNGTQAATYALAWLPEEPEAQRLARFSDVMTKTIQALPDDKLRVEQMLTSLGGSARTTTSTGDVADFLLQMRAGILEGGQQVRVLPTTDIDAGTSLAVVRADLAAAQVLLESLLPTALLDSAESNPRVLVQNGVGTPGLGASARDRIVDAGMVYINGGNAEEFGQKQTLVIIEDATVEARQLGADVAEALGVPRSGVAVAEEGQNVADVVVILGADFEP